MQLRHPHIVDFIGVSLISSTALILMVHHGFHDWGGRLALHWPSVGTALTICLAPMPDALPPNHSHVQECCCGGDLFSAVGKGARDKNGQLLLGWYRHGRHIALDIAKGLNYLHVHKVSSCCWVRERWQVGTEEATKAVAQSHPAWCSA